MKCSAWNAQTKIAIFVRARTASGSSSTTVANIADERHEREEDGGISQRVAWQDGRDRREAGGDRGKCEIHDVDRAATAECAERGEHEQRQERDEHDDRRFPELVRS